MPEFVILRVNRTPIREVVDGGITLEFTDIHMRPIFTPISAPDSIQALKLAVEAHPHFRTHIAVMEKRAYERQAYFERQRIRELRTGTSNPPGGKRPARKIEAVH